MKAAAQAPYVNPTRAQPRNGVETFGGSMCACLAYAALGLVTMVALVWKKSTAKGIASFDVSALADSKALCVRWKALWWLPIFQELFSRTV